MRAPIKRLKLSILIATLMSLGMGNLFAQCDIEGITIDAGTIPYFGNDLTTCGAGDNLTSENTINCGSSGYLQGEELIITFQVAQSTLYHISLTNASENYTSLKLYDGCPLQEQNGACVATLENNNPNKILPVELETGKTYYLAIGRWYDECFQFDLSIDLPQTCPEPGEPGWQAISLPYNQQGLTTCGAGDNLTYDNTIRCGSNSYLQGEEIVFIFEAPETQLYHINLTGATDNYTSLKLYDGCPLLSQDGSCVAQSESSDSDRVFPVELVAGQTYYLVVTHYDEGCFNFNLSIDVPATCPEPGSPGWQAISLPYNQEGLTTCGAGDNLTYANTIRCGSNSYLQGEELVFIFEAPETKLYHINLTGATDNYSSLKLYDGCPLISQGASCVAQSESSDADRVFPVELVAGKTYYLVVTHYDEGCFNFNLSIDVPETCPEPGSPGWQAISLPFNQQGLTTCGAGDNLTYANVIQCGSDGYLQGEEIVFIFEAPETQLYHINLTGATDNYSSLKLYDGCPLISQGASCVAQSESSDPDRVFPVDLEAGQTYYLVVTHYDEGCFNFNLSIDVPATCPEPGSPGWDLVTLPYSENGLTTCGMGNFLNYANMVQCGSDIYLTGEERVFVFEASQTALYSISLQNSTSTYTSLKLFDGCPLISSGGSCVANSASSASNRIIEADLMQGTTYYLVVSNYYDDCFEFSLEINTQCLTPVPVVAQPAPVCEGSPMPELTVSNPEGTVSWYANPELTELLATGTSYTPQTDTTATFYVTNSLECESEPTPVLVNVILHPKIESVGLVVPGNYVCEGASFTLTINEGTSWLWSTGESTSSITATATQSGIISAVTEYEGCNLTSDISITVLENTTPDPITGMTPPDNTVNVSLSPTLSWIPGSNSTSFDVYLWKTSDGDRPENPISESLQSAQISLKKGDIEYDTDYSWQILSRNGDCGITEGPVQTFTTQDLPNLIISDLVIQTDGFSGQSMSVTFQVFNAGNAGTGNESWRDALFLSLDNNLDLDVDVLLDTWTNQKFLLPGESYTQTVEVTIPQQYLGDYYFIVAANYNCAVRTRGVDGLNFFNACDHLASETTLADNWRVTESSIAFSWPPLPDLNPTSFGTPELAFAGDTINISYSVDNIGQELAKSNFSRLVRNMCASTMGGFVGDPAKENKAVFALRDLIINCVLTEPFWLDMIYLSTSPVHDPENDILIATEIASFKKDNFIANGNTIPKPYESVPLSERIDIIDRWENTQGYLDAGSNYQKNLQAVLPNCIDGEYYIHLIADYSGWIWEFDLSNNIITRPLQIITTPPPDLVVSNAKISDDLASGELAALDYEIENTGAGKPAKGFWYDAIYLMPTPEFDEETAILVKGHGVLGGETLEPGQSMNVSTSFRIPNGINGQYYVYIHTNAFEPVCEFDPENNFFTLPVIIELTPPPDLIVTNLAIVGETIAESVINLSYTTLNQGAGTASGPWKDKVYLSQSSDFIPNSKELLFGYNHTDTLLPDQSKVTPVEVRIPSVAEGNWYIYVQTNVEEAVYEHGKTDNNVFRSGPWEIKQRLTSDLEAANLVIAQAADAGQLLPFSYKVTNKGLVTPNTFSWNEIIYLSDNPTLAEDTIRLIKRVYSAEEINPGEFFERTGSIRIPNGISGTKYIHVIVDGNNRIENELNRDNNIISTTIVITQPPTPDLELVSVELPAVFYAGEPVWVPYKVRNQGTSATQGQWFDKMGASLNRDGMPQGTSFRRQTLQIAPGSQYTDSMQITMPLQFSGTYYFSVSLDSQNDIYEHEGEDNNISGYPVVVLQPEPADLIVSEIVSPASAIPGRMTSYSFTLTNQGTNPVRSNYIANLYLEGDDFPGLQSSTLWASERPSLSFLEPGNSISFNIQRAFPGLKDGLINSRVLANANLSVIESDYSNNELVGENPISSVLPILPVNTEVSDTLAMGSSLYYKLNLPDNADLRVRVTSSTGFGENGLFLRARNIPSGPIYDVRNLSGNMASPVLLLPGTTAGDNYLKIENFNAAYIPTQDITIRADVLPFGIDSINPSVMGQGRVTSQVFGAGFRTGAVVELLSQNNIPTLTGRILRFISSMQLEVRWQLEDTPEGIYHLRITNPGGEAVILQNAVKVEPAREFDVALIPIYESIIGDRNPVTIGMIFKNNSNVDVPVVKAGLFYNNAHKLVGIAKQEKIFTHSQVLSGLTGLPTDSFPDHKPYPDEQNDKDMIPLYVRDIAPGQSRELSLTFTNFPFAVFSVGVSMETMTIEEYLNLIAYGGKFARELILSGYDLAGNMGFTPTQREELYELLRSESNYFRAFFQQYISAGLLLPEDTIGFVFNASGLDIPEDYSTILNNQKTNEFTGYSGSSWEYDLKNNLIPIPLPGPGGPSPEPPGPGSCESIGGQAVKFWCQMQTNFSCAGTAVCAGAAIITGIGVYSGILTAPSLALMGELFILCKGFVVGCILSQTINAPTSPEDVFCMEVLKSCDPNEIEGPAGIGDQQFIAQKDRVDYTVYFENDPELASAAAKQVRIAVPISEFANPLSTRLASFGFADNNFDVPVNTASINQRIDLREKEGYYLDVIGGLDIQRNEIFWLLTTIDPSTGQIPVNPFAGFLAINDSTGVGEGYVKFSVTPHESTVTGDTLAHYADIFFDLNPPITTNTHFNTIDAVTPTTVVDELPVFSNEGNLRLSLSAFDDEGGSGLDNVEVYMSRNDKAPVFVGKERKFEWLIDAHTCDSLAFFVRSIDKVGNAEPIPDQFQTYTIIGRSNVSAGDDVILCAGNEVTLTASAGESWLWSTGETSQSITLVPDSTSTYSVVVTNSDGCPGIATVTVTLQDCTFVDENDQPGSLLKVYPNPVVGDEIMTEISGIAAGIYQVRLLDQHGKIVYSEQKEWNTAKATHSIPAAGLSAGTFILEVKGDNYREARVVVISR